MGPGALGKGAGQTWIVEHFDLLPERREPAAPVEPQRLWVIQRAGVIIGKEPGELLMTWASPPCITFSQLDRLRKPEKPHRDLTTPTREAISEEAKRDDLLLAHVARELIEYANGGEEHWEG